MPLSTPEISSLGAGAVGRRLKRDVGHPLHRNVAGGIRVRAAVRAPESLLCGHLPVQLVADESAAGDHVELLLCHPLIVVANGGQAMVDQPISGHVHHLTAVLQRAELVEGCEGSAGVRGLVAQCAIQLGRVPDRLMDGEEQVAGMDHQVIEAGLDRRGGNMGGQQLGNLGHLGVEVPAGAGQVLPAPAGRWSSGPHRRETMITNADCGQLGLDANPLLGRARACEVREVLVLVNVAEQGSGVCDARRRKEHLIEFQDPTGLGSFVNVERIHLIGRHPRGVGVDVLIGQLDRGGRQRAGNLRCGYRALRQVRSRVGGERDVGCEAPDTVVDDTNRQAEHLAIGGGFQHMITEAAVGLAQSLHADLRVAAPELFGLGEGGIAQRPQRQRKKPFIELGHARQRNAVLDGSLRV